MLRPATLALLLASLAACTLPRVAFADAGDPDAGYGSAGVAIAAPGSVVGEVKAAFLQPDNKLLVIGSCVGPADSAADSFCVARFNADGSLDVTGFNAADAVAARRGMAVYSPGVGSNDVASGLLRPDGKIVVMGNCQISAAVAIRTVCAVQLLSDGSLDTGFGTGGWFRAPTELSASNHWPSAQGRRIFQQADGSLIVAALLPVNGSSDAYVVGKLTGAGALDTAFGTQGSIAVQGNVYGIADVVFLAAGQLIFVGRCNPAGFAAVCAQRVSLASAALDTTFGSGGLAAANFAMGANPSIDFEVFAATLQNNGAIVVAGSCGPPPSKHLLCVGRFNANGSLDTTFAAPDNAAIALQSVFASNGNVAGLRAVAVQQDGRIVAAGQCAIASPANPTVFVNWLCTLRIDANGTLDTTFGTVEGTTFTSPGGPNPTGRAVAVQLDGKVLVAGECGATGGSFCVSRLAGDTRCTMDVDGDGQTTATIDGLIVTRAMLGMSGTAVLGGISLPGNARRTTWPQIRAYLVQQCGMTIAS